MYYFIGPMDPSDRVVLQSRSGNHYELRIAFSDSIPPELNLKCCVYTEVPEVVYVDQTGSVTLGQPVAVMSRH